MMGHRFRCQRSTFQPQDDNTGANKSAAKPISGTGTLGEKYHRTECDQDLVEFVDCGDLGRIANLQGAEMADLG